jgi:hypothetical protein
MKLHSIPGLGIARRRKSVRKVEVSGSVTPMLSKVSWTAAQIRENRSTQVVSVNAPSSLLSSNQKNTVGSQK